MVKSRRSLLPKKKKGGMRIARRETIEFYLFISPWIIGFALFYAGPMLSSFFFSLTKYDLLSPPTFVGFENYQKFIADPLFIQSLKVTAIYSVSTVFLTLSVGLLIALLMIQPLRGILMFRALFYMPSVLAGVSVSFIFMWVFSTEYGLANYFVRLVGFKGVDWFGIKMALWTLVLMSVWTAGGPMLIYLAGLMNIPTQLYEAATLDGAGMWRKFRHVTLPMLSPVILLNVVMGFIASFQAFTQAYIMTDGGPARATFFYVYYLFYNAFGFLKMGYASAQAWILLMIILLITLLIFKT